MGREREQEQEEDEEEVEAVSAGGSGLPLALRVEEERFVVLAFLSVLAFLPIVSSTALMARVCETCSLFFGSILVVFFTRGSLQGVADPFFIVFDFGSFLGVMEPTFAGLSFVSVSSRGVGDLIFLVFDFGSFGEGELWADFRVFPADLRLVLPLEEIELLSLGSFLGEL